MIWITYEQYFGPWLNCPDVNADREGNANALLGQVNLLLDAAADAGIDLPVNPITGSRVSGSKFGGFRPQACKEGATHSSHKEAAGVDVFDPDDALDQWLTDEILEQFGLYREHPDSTYLGSDGKPQPWCHLTFRAPPSGRRTFRP